ncbi:MAG: hypothetical protein FJ087_02290 [Deltaproteobacteria bacterium]|nr:hypothetical protein [Deltaproteobacteria bacterium]
METRLHILGHSATAIALVATLAAAGLAVYVWRVKGALGRRDQMVLAGLRLVAVAGVLGAFLQPAIRREEVVRRPSVVLVLADESASMGVMAAGGVTRAEEVARFVKARSGWLDALERDHDVRYLAFSDGVREVTREALAEPLPSAGGSTDLVSAIRLAATGLERSDVGGVLVLTDGIDHGDDLASVGPARVPPARREALQGLPGPVHALMTSAPEKVRDVALHRADGLGYVLDRNVAEVRCELRSVGYDPVSDPPGDTGGRLTVTLSEAGTVLDRVEVPVADTVQGATATLAFLPRGPGRRVLEVSVSPLPDEIAVLNNTRLVVVDVVRDRLRVLHAAGHPSWDQRFLREYLRRRRDVELVSFHTLRAPDAAVLSSDDETTLIPFPAEEIFGKQTEGFDVVILQDHDLPEINRDRYAASLASYVHGGGALLVIGGSYSLGARGPWPSVLDPVLPVTAPRNAAHGMVEARLEVEVPPEAARHPIAADPAWSQRVAHAPPLAAVNVVGATRPGATVLLRAAADPSGPRHPVVVVSQSGLGRTGAILTDALWRWSFDATFDDLYRRVLDGMLAYLTRDPAASPIRVAAARPRLGPGREQMVNVTAPQGVGGIQLLLERRTGPDRFEAAGPAADVATGVPERFAAGGPGVWRATASGVIGDARVEASDVFLVGPSDEEATQILPGAPRLAALAELTGGRVVQMADAAPDALPLRPEVVATVGVHSEDPIWNHPAVFLILVLVLGLEWYVERKIGYT